MDTRISELKQTRDIAITIFRAGIVAVIGVGVMFLYLLMVADRGAAILGGGLGLVIPILCFIVGLVLFTRTVKVLRAYGVGSAGILRRQPRDIETTSNGTEADILRRMESQFRNE